MARKVSDQSQGDDALYCKWNKASFDSLMKIYCIMPEWHPVMPSQKYVVFLLRDGQITLLANFFKFCNFRLPVTRLCKEMLDEYAVHIPKMHPLGLAKLRRFEYSSLSLGFMQEKLIFRAFYTLVWKAPCRDKYWKKRIFFIDADVIPGGMHWRVMASREKVKDDGPVKVEYQENALYKALTAHSSECTVIPKGALVLVGMSMC
ncbi:hypothetical protein Hanom_Chr05g00476171 [Helianthus anomalus]